MVCLALLSKSVSRKSGRITWFEHCRNLMITCSRLRNFIRPETFGLCNLLFVIRYSDICSWTTLLLRHMVFDISSLFYLPLRLLLFWFLKMPKTTLLLRHLLFKTFAFQTFAIQTFALLFYKVFSKAFTCYSHVNCIKQCFFANLKHS